MNLFIDGEWNGYGGELISLALVAEDGRTFYEVLGCDNPDPWVAQNVMPKLEKPWIVYQSLQDQLELFLSQFDEVHVVADWPEDVMWFCMVLITGPGTRINTPPLTMEVLRVDTVSSNPHNALADAMALRDWYTKQALGEAMSIDAMKLALEALELWSPALGHALNKRAEAVVALRAAIEQAEKPWVKTYSGGQPNYTEPLNRKPVAWRKHYENSGYTYFDERWKTIPNDAEPLFSD